jgi:hypothetical protein
MALFYGQCDLEIPFESCETLFLLFLNFFATVYKYLFPSCTLYFQVSTSTGSLKASQAKLQEDLSNKVSAHKYPCSFQRRLSQMTLFRTLLWTSTTPATTSTITATTSTCTVSPWTHRFLQFLLMVLYHENVWLFRAHRARRWRGRHYPVGSQI